MLKVAILSHICPDALSRLKRAYDCRVVVDPDEENKKQVLKWANVAIVRSPVVLDRPVLEEASNLVLIVRAGAGLERIDIDFAEARNMKVVVVPLSADSVAEHALGLMLSLSRRIPLMHGRMRQGVWEKHRGLGVELTAKTLGLIGFGRIGRRLAELSTPFRMDILAYDRSPEDPVKIETAHRFGVDLVDFEKVLSDSDVLSIQVPLNSESRTLIDAGSLRSMKRGVLVVNVGRGEVVDESALYEALVENRIGGAALDVFGKEPPGAIPLLMLENFVATPHVGAQTVEAQKKVGKEVVQIIESFAEGN